MNAFEQLAHDVDSSIYLIRAAEVMRWGHEDLCGSLKQMLLEMDEGEQLAIHCRVSFDTMLKYGPLHERIQHIVPDFVVVDQSRQPIAIIDYLGAGHDDCHDGVKQAVARKMGMGYLAVAADWDYAQVKQQLMAKLGGKGAARAIPEVHALQELLKRQDFGPARAA